MQNGHRFVFHYGEVQAQERQYLQGEPGVHNPPPVLVRTHLQARNPQPDRTVDQQRDSDMDALEKDALSLMSTQASENPTSVAAGQTTPPLFRPSRAEGFLLDGDVVYWHQLKNSGERAIIMGKSPW